MVLFSRPDESSIRAFLGAQRSEGFSYAHAGASQGPAPNGYTVDHNRIQLGRGPRIFESAANAIRKWKMFEMSWLHLCWPDTPIEMGATVAVLISHFGFFSLNAARIVYVIDERGSPERFGFAYGTLSDHAERGEERFIVEFHPDDQTVWYDLYAFSRPAPVTWLGYPVARTLQKRFIRDSKKAMLAAIADAVA
jgi:uncharacterized protein (UPF0548 family)